MRLTFVRHRKWHATPSRPRFFDLLDIFEESKWERERKKSRFVQKSNGKITTNNTDYVDNDSCSQVCVCVRLCANNIVWLCSFCFCFCCCWWEYHFRLNVIHYIRDNWHRNSNAVANNNNNSSSDGNKNHGQTNNNLFDFFSFHNAFGKKRVSLSLSLCR